MIRLFTKAMHHFGCHNHRRSSDVQRVDARSIRTLNTLANTEKTKGFEDLDQGRDDNFGKLLRELSKE